MTRFGTIERRAAGAAIGFALLLASPIAGLAQDHGAHDPASTPVAWSCDAPPASPAASHDDGMDHGAMEDAEFDQLYIDMMLPHHGSIIALSEAALPRLTDPRLQEMAQAIIDAQTTENAQLVEWREAWYGSGEPATDEASMNAMLEAMPVATMDEMMQEMDPAWQVSAFCAAANPDLAFIQQAIPHHQMAIDVSVIAVEKAVHPELATFAQGVIDAQQAEIDLLNTILEEYEATPES